MSNFTKIKDESVGITKFYNAAFKDSSNNYSRLIFSSEKINTVIIFGHSF